MRRNTDWQQQTHPIERDPANPIEHLMPHYSNEYFKSARTVYLAPGYKTNGGDPENVKDAGYDYSDRIREWHTNDEYEVAWDAAKASSHQPRSAAYLEVYLRTIMGKPTLKLIHVLAGVNWGNGYPYQVYGYIIETEEQE